MLPGARPEKKSVAQVKPTPQAPTVAKRTSETAPRMTSASAVMTSLSLKNRVLYHPSAAEPVTPPSSKETATFPVTAKNKSKKKNKEKKTRKKRKKKGNEKNTQKEKKEKA